MSTYDISVVIPVHKKNRTLHHIRESLYQTNQKIEIIYVVDDSLKNVILPLRNNEKILVNRNTGRGYMLQKGVSIAQGNTIVFLHIDTLLPEKWDTIIVKTMQDPTIIGGAFNLSFDYRNLFLKLIEKIVTCLYYKTGILSGDRAMFVRTMQIKKALYVLNTPIFEDAELSRWMKKQGRVVLLKESVITSADAFKQQGMLRHAFRILICSFRYEVGDNLDKIFRYYYK
jgi:glycosyltransferase involved in cell wall biosynthesis